MTGSILGNRVVRKEDPMFLTSGGRYVDDLDDVVELAGAAFVVYVRSAIAHGTITTIDTDGARAMPGVVDIITAADLGLEPLASPFNRAVARPLLATDRVRYVGEPILVVVAETREQAADAADAVIVDYDVLDAVVDPIEAMTSSTVLYDAVGTNVVHDSTTTMGLPDLTGDDLFAGCEVTVSGTFVNQRVAPCPLEVRGSSAVWVDGRLHQWVSTQHAQGIKRAVVRANGVDATDVRILTPDVGGGFGAKIGSYPEELLLGPIARRIGRAVRWQETRSESMMALGHGRGQIQRVTIGGRRDGTVTHYRLHAIQDAGAFADMGTILAPFMTRPMASGVYDIPTIECRTTSVVTNTTPIVAYRGAGRPEATAAIERAMDLFAAELGLDAADVRRTNLIAPFTQPHTTTIGQTYDVGDFVGALDRVLAAAGYTELRAEQARRRAAGESLLLGIGVSVYVEITGAGGLAETAKIEVLDDGTAVIYTGTSPHGQGHDTSWSMIASAQTGIPIDRMRLVWGDTDLVPSGGGTSGSRSLQQGGAAVDSAAVALVEQARALAARSLEADEADVVLDTDAARFHVAGTPAVSRSWSDLATVAAADGNPLEVEVRFTAASPTFPFGAHVAVVEVDVETGGTRLVRHIACDDAGRRLNPLILEGQIHGGIAQGAAQALLEEVRYDDDGNPVTSNLADYGMISATELPSFELVAMETPTPVNPLGAKGIGESGTIGSTPAVQSAVVDAVGHLGVRHIDMPATAERVWRAIQVAAGRAS
ncbi:MAG: xanthine dehydrogenase family protein molybdopterin-binding subunit [Ilumatobacteraceae bacterium]